MGFNMLFYIIFGTNLLTGSPVPVSVFLPIFEFCRKGIPNGVQTKWNLRDDLSWNNRNPEDLELKSWTPRCGQWYVSNVPIIFYCSMLLYYLFWMFMGFTLHFYIIFGTNLLTEGPTHIVVFLPISVFWRKGISNGVQTEWNLRESYFWNGSNPGYLE